MLQREAVAYATVTAVRAQPALAHLPTSVLLSDCGLRIVGAGWRDGRPLPARRSQLVETGHAIPGAAVSIAASAGALLRARVS